MGLAGRPVRLWRIAREPFVALDGAGALRFGGRYSPPGLPIVYFASEPGLAVLVALRYLPNDPQPIDDDYVLGWTEADLDCKRISATLDDQAILRWSQSWAEERRSPLAAIASRVLPEADIIMLNPRHPQAARIAPLTTRRFRFSDCLHEPPMLSRFGRGSG